MASIFNLYSFDLSTGEKFEISQSVFEAFQTKPEIASVHDVVTDIKSGDIIPMVGLLDDFGTCLSGCDIDSATAQIPMSNKRWAPVNVGGRLAHCERDAEKIFNGTRGRMNKMGKWDATGDPHMQVVMGQSEDALQEIILRYGWFGDTSADNVSGGGAITNGKYLTLFNCLDGLWKQIFDNVGTGDSNFVAISKNGEASYAAQLALGDTDGRDTLRKLYEKADPRLINKTDKVYLVTSTLYNNFLAEIEEGQVSNGTLGTTQLNGTQYRTYREVPIIVVDYWDRMIRTYEDTGTKYNLPHRALLTTPGNLPIGFVENDPFTVDSFYDKKDKQVYIDVEVDMDAKMLETYLISAAY